MAYSLIRQRLCLSLVLLREALLIFLLLLPLLLSYLAGVLFAVGRRSVWVMVEGFRAGVRLIDG